MTNKNSKNSTLEQQEHDQEEQQECELGTTRILAASLEHQERELETTRT
jgi:hypothetical protein